MSQINFQLFSVVMEMWTILHRCMFCHPILTTDFWPDTTLCWCGRYFMLFCFSVSMLYFSRAPAHIFIIILPKAELYNIKHLFSMFLCGQGRGFRYCDSKTEQRPLIYDIFHIFMVSKSVAIFSGIIIEFNVRNVKKIWTEDVWYLSMDSNR